MVLRRPLLLVQTLPILKVSFCLVKVKSRSHILAANTFRSVAAVVVAQGVQDWKDMIEEFHLLGVNLSCLDFFLQVIFIVGYMLWLGVLDSGSDVEVEQGWLDSAFMKVS